MKQHYQPISVLYIILTYLDVQYYYMYLYTRGHKYTIIHQC